MDFFKSGPNYSKLKTNLRLTVNRLKLLEKKRTEIGLKSRPEIASYIKQGKIDRARIRVEHVVREDYAVEAMEMIEMYADLLLARFGLIETMPGLDTGLEEAIASILWAAPRLRAEVPEIGEVSNQLTAKYGQKFAEECRQKTLNNVNEKLLHKMEIIAPAPSIVEKYLVLIACDQRVDFKPDPNILNPDELRELLPEPSQSNTQPPAPDGGAVYPSGGAQPPPLPSMPPVGQPHGPPSSTYKPGPPQNTGPPPPNMDIGFSLPDVPSSGGEDQKRTKDVDFDDLEARFDRLRKK